MKTYRAAPIVTHRDDTRSVSIEVCLSTHAELDARSKSQDVAKATLARLLVEDGLRDPERCARVVAEARAQ